MGKRSSFERVERDFYPTPLSAVIPLFPFLIQGTRFAEPCAGNGALTQHLISAGHTPYWQSDIHPMQKDIHTANALELTNPLAWADCIITNPPWDRKILHPMITHFRTLNKTWLLFDSDWAFTKQSIHFMPYCSKIVAVGRVKWIEGSKSTGKDNCSWYCFEKQEITDATKFYPRSGVSGVQKPLQAPKSIEKV
jgi:hypothetical protein